MRRIALEGGMAAVERLVHGAGGDPGQGRIGTDTYLAALRALRQAGAPPDLAARVGAAVRPADVGLWHYLVIASDTLGEALERGAHFLPLLLGPLRHHLQTGAPRADGCVPLVLAGTLPEALLDLWLTALLGPLAEGLTPAGFGGPAVRELWLARPPRPRDATGPLAGIPQARGIPLRFLAPMDALWLPPSSLSAPMAGADPDVVRALSAQALERLARQLRPTTWSERVQQAVACELRTGPPELERVARTLGVSRATLTRRLAAEGEHFRAISDRLRAEAAKRHLIEGRLSISEIAYGLGFANAAAFHRAFKRWTDMNPGEYRRG